MKIQWHLLARGLHSNNLRWPSSEGGEAGGGRHPETSAGDTNELLTEAFFTGSPMANPLPPCGALAGAASWGRPHPGLRRAPRFLTRGYFCVALRAAGKPLEEVLARLE